MQLIKQEKLNKIIKEEFNYPPEGRTYINMVLPEVDRPWADKFKNSKSALSFIKILIAAGIGILIFLLGWDIGTKMCDEYLEQQKEGLSQEEIDSIVKKIFLKNLEQYKKGYTPYSFVFKEAIDKYAELNCVGPLVFYWHYEDLVKYMQTDQQFIEAASSLGLIDRTYQRDIDNDGENEIIFSRIDLPNREFVSFSIIDKIDDNYKIIENKIDGGHDGYIELLDVTGDLHPEIAFFIGFGKGGYKLFIYEYQKDKKSKEIFSSRDNDIYYSNYTFSDMDNDNKIEIKINGEIRHTPEHGKKVQRIYEYDSSKNAFNII